MLKLVDAGGQTLERQVRVIKINKHLKNKCLFMWQVGVQVTPRIFSDLLKINTNLHKGQIKSFILFYEA